MYYLLLFNIKHYLFNNACLYYIPIYHFHTYILKMLLRVNFRIFNAVLFAEQFFKNYSLICCPSQSKSVSYLILRSMRCDNYELNKRFIWLFDSTCVPMRKISCCKGLKIVCCKYSFIIEKGSFGEWIAATGVTI